jgi:hypothetical protein
MAPPAFEAAVPMTTDGALSAPGLLLPDAASLSDLRTFVGRAVQVDQAGAVRLVAQGEVLAMYAGVLHGGVSPTVLALRVLTLGEPADLDATVSGAALLDRLAPIHARPGPGRAPIRVPLPSGSPTGATWAGMLPPRSGWSAEGVLHPADLRRVARAGIDEVAAGAPAGSGASAVARLRGLVWGRPLPGHQDLPAGAAFAAEIFGFLKGPAEVFDQDADHDVVSLHRAGPWWRLSAPRGHILARPPIRL